MAATLKVDTIQNASSATANITLDTNGNATTSGVFSMSSSFLRNRLINGGHAIDQRNAGASQTITAGAALAYTVDRWYAYCTGANVTGQQVAGTAPAQYAYKFTGATSNTLVGFGQRIEQINSYDLASGAVTVSAYMSASTNTTITWYLYGPSSTADTFGTIASPTVTQIATGTFSVTGSRTQFTATISAASMVGFNKGLELRFVAASGLGNAVTWTIDSAQLEAGSVATPYERRLYGQELTLCQRYYQKLTAPLGQTQNASNPYTGTVAFRTTMRAAPTLDAGATFAVGSGLAGTVAFSGVGSNPTNTDFAAFINSAANWSAGTYVSVTAGLNSEL